MVTAAGTRDSSWQHNIRVPYADAASVRNVQIVPMSSSRPGKLLVSQSIVDTFELISMKECKHSLYTIRKLT